MRPAIRPRTTTPARARRVGQVGLSDTVSETMATAKSLVPAHRRWTGEDRGIMRSSVGSPADRLSLTEGPEAAVGVGTVGAESLTTRPASSSMKRSTTPSNTA